LITRLFAIAAVVVCLAPRAQAKTSIDPLWGHARAPRLDPFRRLAAGDGAAAPRPATPPAAPARCERDDQCAGESICEGGFCKPIEMRTNIFYLYYREGAFREALLLYWARKSNPGYTVLAPFYWHYWSPTSETRVVAPFYWRFEDRLARTTMTWYGPAVVTHGPLGTGFGLLPLFYAGRGGNWAAPLLGTFAFHDPETHTAIGAAAFLYWWRRTPARATDLAFPLFFSTRAAQSGFTFALPLNFYWRRGDSSSLLAFPLFFWNRHATGSWLVTWLGYAHREGSAFGRSVAWLYWWGGDDKEPSSYHVLAPLFWDFAGKKDRTTIGFPLFWRFRGPGGNTTVAANFVHVREGSWSFDTFFPLYWSAGDDRTGRVTRLLLPLFLWHRADQDRSAWLVTPLGGYARDRADQTRTWLALPFLSWGHSDRGGERRMITPLYYSHQDRDHDSTTRVVGLLFYRRTDAQGSTTSLFPLFWRFWDAPTGATATALLPLFARRSGPRDETTFVGPIYWRRFKNGGWGAGLVPLAWFGSNAGLSHAVVFPLFWRFASSQSSTTVGFPIFYTHRDRHGYDAGVPALLLFFGRHAERSYAVQFPLLFRAADARAGTSTTVTPLGFVQTDRDGTSVGVGPIVPLLYVRAGRQRSHVALFPLFWHFTDRAADRSTTVVGPYWHRRWGGETTDALFPLLYFRRGARPGGGDETAFTLFPLFHYHRDAQLRLWITPLAASGTGPRHAAGFVGPYFWYRSPDLRISLIPVLHTALARAGGERLNQWGPWFRISGPGYAATGIVPLFGHYRDAHESDTWIVPDYFRLRRDNGDAVDTLPPLFWRSSFGGRVTTVIGPYFSRSSEAHHAVGVVPLFLHDRTPNRTLTVVPPLLFFHTRANDGSSSRTWALLLFYHHRDPSGHSTALFPLFWSTGDRDGERDVLFPLFWHFADRPTDSAWTLAGPLFWAHAGTRHTVGLLPLAWVSRDPAAAEHSVGVMPLFYQHGGPDLFSLYTPVAGYHRKGTFSFWYAGPIVHTDSLASSFSMVAPLWFRHTDKATETTTTVIPPLLHVSRSTPETAVSSTLGLFWNFRDIASSTWVGLPLYYDVHTYGLSRFTMFLPFFGRYADEATHESTTIAPLFYRHTTPTTITMVGFPLVWDIKRDQVRTTVVFPFYAHWVRPEQASTYVFPNYYRRTGLAPNGKPDGTWRRYVFPFYDSGVDRPGDFSWEVLGGLFGHERIGRHNYLRLFYFTVETEPTQPQQAAWYGKAREPRRKAVPRGFNVAGW
jgi:hypothetical protein